MSEADLRAVAKIDFAAPTFGQLVSHFSFSTSSCPLNRYTSLHKDITLNPCLFFSRSEVALGLGALHAKAQLDFRVLGGNVPLSCLG